MARAATADRETPMTLAQPRRTPTAAAVLGAALAASLSASAALAGPADPVKECPVEHRLAQPRELTALPDEGTVREVLTHVNISGWRGVDGFALRTRRITVRPGGWVPLHYHFDRPSVDYVIEGELVEHHTFCAVPIVHRAGDSSNRFGDFLGHWWKNETDRYVVLISSDVVPLENVNF
jgi:quercetin dioxygenase-like cupin family protein